MADTSILKFKKLRALQIPLALLAIAALVLGFRLSNWNSIFHDGGVYFIDGDCYSRMTRVEMVSHGYLSIREHSFENFPDGTKPHTTALLDWIIALGALFVGRDIAGAWVGPLLSLAAAYVFYFVFRKEKGCWLGLVFFAVSPILVHGGSLGRPDHQLLQIFLLTLFLTARWRGFERSEKSDSLLAGISLGLALWVSLYEPLILGALFLILELCFNRRRLFNKIRLWELGSLVGILVLSVLIDGVRWSPPGGELFTRWAMNIGELHSAPPFSAAVRSWIGWFGYYVIGAIIWLSYQRRDLRLAAWSLFVLVLFALVAWQARWSYFLVLGLVFVVPASVSWIRPAFLSWILFLGLMLPVWNEWDRKWDKAAVNAEDHSLREVADYIKQNAATNQGILAPWWYSPKLAYWSGVPCVAGSSHQSLPGIEASARFYLESRPNNAKEILRQRKVGWVVLPNDPFGIYQESERLIQVPHRSSSMGTLLTDRTSVPSFLKFSYVNDGFKVYRVILE